MKTTYTGKEIKAMIKEVETGKEYKLNVTRSSSYGVSDEANSLYQKLRYHVKKMNADVKVTREYNQIMLVKC